MVNNYSHDIATAFLFVSGLVMWTLFRTATPEGGDPGAFYVRVCRAAGTVAKLALCWILIAGVPRVIFYRSFEWSDMAGSLQVPAIVVKHVVMFSLVAGGLYFWSRLSRSVRELESKYSYPSVSAGR